MNQILELRQKRARLWEHAKAYVAKRTTAGTSLRSLTEEEEAEYNAMVDEVQRLGREIEKLERENVRQLESQPEKPPLGAKPYYITAWSRIGELAEAIYRQYEAAKGDPKLVGRWAEEIGWQCAMIQSLQEDENDG